MTHDFLDVLFRTRSHFNELIARADAEGASDEATLEQLKRQVDKLNEAINQVIAKGFTAPVAELEQANGRLEGLNKELAEARESNERLKFGIEIAAKVIQVVAQVAGLLV